MQTIPENQPSYQTTPKFRLDTDFVRKYSKIRAPFGFNGLGALTYRRTYSRIKENGFNESWDETVERVVNGIYNMQKEWVESRGLGWNDKKAQKSAQEMYDAIFMMRFTPPGRGLWAAGTGIIEERKIYAALNNCAFISTENIAKEKDMAFRFLMDMSMLGVGCGFDVRGAGKILVKKPKVFKEYAPPDEDVEIVYKPNLAKTATLQKYIEFLQAQISVVKERITGAKSEYEKSGSLSDLEMYTKELEWAQSLDVRGIQTYVIEDSREGWVEATGRIIRTYLRGAEEPVYPIVFDYSQIRKKGLPLRTFGGKSSGPEPLLDLHIMCRVVLGENSGSEITTRTIVDLMNLIGKCVIAGNVRRTAEIALGEYNDEEFINLKNYVKNPERVSYGWCSNNSVFGYKGMDYEDIAQRIVDNGEPGIIWMDNIRGFSRMNGIRDDKDFRAVGTNPCSEQSLENAEYCTLVEVFIGRCKTKEEFLRTLKFAYLYAKTITLGQSHWPETNRAMMRNRRIGCSLTGIAQFLHEQGIEKLREWCEEGYNTIQHWDEIYSNWFCIPRSIKTTSIKPSGCLTADSRVRIVEVGENRTKMFNMSIKDIFVHYGHDLLGFGEDSEQKWLEAPCNGNKLYVFNAKNELEPISRLYCNGFAEIYEVPLADGSSIKCTGEHKWLVQQGINQIWKKTVDLEEGDMIVQYA